MNRRAFISFLGGTATWPLVARAQQRAIPVIGYLGGETLESSRDRMAIFHRGLGEAGYVEGRNVGIEYRWAEYRYDRLPALAAELVNRQLAVIVVGGSAPGALALKAATQAIPIVFMIGPDPIRLGLVTSLNRPGGNITGVTTINVEVIAKRLELLHQLVPAATTIGLLQPMPPQLSLRRERWRQRPVLSACACWSSTRAARARSMKLSQRLLGSGLAHFW
jgi:putative tryptophan/tyrosine transport system substrate-binding protein